MTSVPIGGVGHPRARRYLVHPSRRRLQAWLDGGESDLDDHLATCARCADRLEEAAAPQAQGSLTDALLAILAPPAELAPRLHAGLAARMQARDDMTMLAHMLGIPVETVGLLAVAPTEDDDEPDAS